jgi:hypothetical protein
MSTILLNQEEAIIKDEAEHAVSHLISLFEVELNTDSPELTELVTANTEIAIFDNNGKISEFNMDTDDQSFTDARFTKGNKY